MKQTVLVIFCLTFFILANFAYAYPSLKISTNTTLSQQSGTTSDYVATVTNVGDKDLEEVYLSISFLPSQWYNVKEKIFLPAGSSSALHYKLSLPSDAVGSIKYNLTAKGILGIGIVAQDNAEVFLSITAVNGKEKNQEQNNQQSTTTVETIQPPQEDFLERYKWLLASALITVGIISAMAAYVFWRN
jgi:hypothetical protein